MIRIEIQGESYQIPTSWKDVTLSRYIAFHSLPEPSEAEIICFFSGIPQSKISQLCTESWLILHEILSFPWNNLTSLPAPEFDISRVRYGAYVDALAAIEKSGNSPVFAAPHLLAYFDKRFIENLYNYDTAKEMIAIRGAMPVAEVLSEAIDKISKTVTYANLFAKRLKQIPQTQEEKASGIENLAKWGALNVVDSLSGGDPTKHDYFFQMRVGHIHTLILKKNEEAYYSHRLSQEYAKKHRK